MQEPFQEQDHGLHVPYSTHAARLEEISEQYAEAWSQSPAAAEAEPEKCRLTPGASGIPEVRGISVYISK